MISAPRLEGRARLAWQRPSCARMEHKRKNKKGQSQWNWCAPGRGIITGAPTDEFTTERRIEMSGLLGRSFGPRQLSAHLSPFPSQSFRNSRCHPTRSAFASIWYDPTLKDFDVSVRSGKRASISTQS